MKKRLMSVVLAAVLICTMMVSASAVLVPSITRPEPDIDRAEMSDGTEVTDGDLVISAQDATGLSTEKQHELEQAITQMNQFESVPAFLADAELTESVEAMLPESIQVEDLVVLDVFDVSAYGSVQEALTSGATITVRFTIQGLTEDDSAVVLHCSNGVWEVRPSTVGDGYVEATFDSLSPVAILVEKDSDVELGGAGGSVSPETGEGPMMTVLVCVAALSALVAGYAVIRVKRA